MPNNESIPDYLVFREKILDFLQKRVLKYPLDLSVPEEYYEHFQAGMGHAQKVQDMEVEIITDARKNKIKHDNR